MIKLVQVIQANQNSEYYLRDVSINPAHIVSINPSDKFIMLLHQNKLPDGLDEAYEFVEISLLNGKTIIAVGSSQIINEKNKNRQKIALRVIFYLTITKPCFY